MATKKRAWRVVSLLAGLALVLAACDMGGSGGQATAIPTSGSGGSGELEIFSWWTAGGEKDSLDELFKLYGAKYPGVKITNSAVGGGAGTNAKTVLETRMTNKQPPDSFQVHNGSELLDTWVKTGYMEALTPLYSEGNWTGVFPAGLLDTLKDEKGDIYAVPVGIHRGNVLWFNQKIFKDNGLSAPATWDGFFKAADTLKGKGITPLAIGIKETWVLQHIFEDILAGQLELDQYKALFKGRASFDSQPVKDTLTTMKRLLDYSNSDAGALTWDQAAAQVKDGKAGMTIMGDWASGWFTANNFQPIRDYGWAPVPGTAGKFMLVVDTFGIPKGAPDRDNAVNWIKMLASKEGQEAFSPKKGSIPGRTDVDRNKFNTYSQSALDDYAKGILYPSSAHGAATLQAFSNDLQTVLAQFVSSKDVDGTAKALQDKAVSDLKR